MTHKQFIKKWRKNLEDFEKGKITLMRYLANKCNLSSFPSKEEWVSQERIREAGRDYMRKTFRKELK